jgi:hypothetical protein
MSENKSGIVKLIAKIAREERLKYEQDHGRVRSKCWSSKLSRKQERRKLKLKLNEMVSKGTIDSGDYDV